MSAGFNAAQEEALNQIEKLLRDNFDASFLSVCAADEHGQEFVQCAATGGVMRVSGMLLEGRRLHEQRIAIQSMPKFLGIHPPHEAPPPDPES